MRARDLASTKVLRQRLYDKERMVSNLVSCVVFAGKKAGHLKN